MRQINAKLRIPSKPIRTVLRWQLIATAVLAVAAGMLAGAHGALSAALGGTISVCAGWMSAVATRGRDASAGGVLLTAFKAEGVKLGVLALLSWLVLRTYAEVVVAVFLGSLVATVLIFSMAFFVREHDKKS
jgi:ATP synthase protein I